MGESREALIRGYLAAERQVTRLKQLVQTNNQKLADVQKKMDMIMETRERATEAQQNQENLECQIGDLERLLAKVETLAASENSRHNSTPEVRKINQRIEEALEEVQRVEAKASALALDCSYLEHEIESTRTEFEERKNAATILLENRYKSIQDIRHELANARRTSLQTFLERQQKHAAQEIEFVRLQTNVLVYRQLLTSVQLEVNCLNSRDQSAIMNLRRELEQVELAIKQVPIHDPLDPKDVLALQRSCDDCLREINATETELKEYIIKMSQAEGSQDKLAKEIQQAEDMNESLRVGLAAEDTLTGELEREIEITKLKTASNTQDQIAELERKIALEEMSMMQKQKQLSDLRRADSDQSISPAMQSIVGRMQRERRRVEERIKELQHEKLDIAAQNARLSMASSPVPLGEQDDGY
jgi:hypothetical protein